MIKNKKMKKNWSEEDLKIFLWIISKYCDYKAIQNIEKDLVIILLLQTREDWQ